MRIPVVAGNWKMNLNTPQALELINVLKYGLPYPGDVDVIVAPTFLTLREVANNLHDSFIGIAAQNIFFEDQGAFTGECSGPYIKDAGADYVIVGHSERRQFFFETDEIINKKIKACFRNTLIPIFCVGETLAEREEDRVFDVLEKQITDGLMGLTGIEVSTLILAYEPIWAIGTGKTATAHQAADAHKILRSLITNLFGYQTAEALRILYGGSVKPENSRDLFSIPDVDGALVGGASLKATDFIEIIKNIQ